MAIFEKRSLGPDFMDLGTIVGYVEGDSKQEIRDRLNCHDGFTQFKEITKDEYDKRKENAFRAYKATYEKLMEEYPI